jgi:hypothetical protein
MTTAQTWYLVVLLDREMARRLDLPNTLMELSDQAEAMWRELPERRRAGLPPPDQRPKVCALMDAIESHSSYRRTFCDEAYKQAYEDSRT